MRAPLVLATVWVLPGALGLAAQDVPSGDRAYPIIDVHLHALGASSYGPPPQSMCYGDLQFLGWDPTTPLDPASLVRCPRFLSGATSDEDLIQRSVEIMRREDVIGVTSGPRLSMWQASAPDRIIPGLLTDFAGLSPSELRAMLESGEVEVLGEITTQYRGLAPDDPSLEPYWSLAEEFDVPVGIHMGTGPPGQAAFGARAYRASNGDPLLLEDVLARHPRLRVYVMHAGYPYLDNIISLMMLHPQVYVGTGLIGWLLPRREFHYFLERLVAAGFEERIMFGTDQMVWPEAIELSIEAIETADFLSPGQRRAIFHDNAQRFLRR